MWFRQPKRLEHTGGECGFPANNAPLVSASPFRDWSQTVKAFFDPLNITARNRERTRSRLLAPDERTTGLPNRRSGNDAAIVAPTDKQSAFPLSLDGRY